MVELRRFHRADPLASILEGLDADGGVIIDDFVDSDVADLLAEDFGNELAEVPWGNNDEIDGGAAGDAFFGYKTKRLHGLIGRSPAFEQVLTGEFPMRCAQALLGEHSKDVILSTSELMAIGPQEEQQAFHRDGDTWQYIPRPRPELLVSFNLALTDFTADNGATVVVPGSHRWERSRKPQPEEIAKAIMSKGSALFYIGEVIHGGGTNCTDETRVGMYFGYIPSWLRPLENSYVTVTEPVMRGLGAEAQKLVGYTETGFQVVV